MNPAQRELLRRQTRVRLARERMSNEAADVDHIEPATFAWTRGGYMARQAARRFAESIDDPAPGDPGAGEAGGE